jgi:RNA polymerase sigma-70 factor, ECF subfamily
MSAGSVRLVALAGPTREAALGACRAYPRGAMDESQRARGAWPLDHRTTPEADLVARLVQGDPSALGEAYDAHHVHVRAFVQRLLGDESAAEDLTHETFVTLARIVRRFRGDSSLRTFLLSIAINHARHHLRGAKRRRAAHERLEIAPPPSSSSPETDLRRRQLAAALTRALDTLPLEQRVAIVLCEVEQRTSAEAARIVGVSEGTIRTRVFHGKRRLRQVLADEGLR